MTLGVRLSPHDKARRSQTPIVMAFPPRLHLHLSETIPVDLRYVQVEQYEQNDRETNAEMCQIFLHGQPKFCQMGSRKKAEAKRGIPPGMRACSAWIGWLWVIASEDSYQLLTGLPSPPSIVEINLFMIFSLSLRGQGAGEYPCFQYNDLLQIHEQNDSQCILNDFIRKSDPCFLKFIKWKAFSSLNFKRSS